MLFAFGSRNKLTIPEDQVEGSASVAVDPRRRAHAMKVASADKNPTSLN